MLRLVPYSKMPKRVLTRTNVQSRNFERLGGESRRAIFLDECLVRDALESAPPPKLVTGGGFSSPSVQWGRSQHSIGARIQSLSTGSLK